MINTNEFRHYAHQFVDWMADFFEHVEQYPVKPSVKPGDIYSQLPDQPPVSGESIDQIMLDFSTLILPGMTHWQSPNFFAYFPANSSYPSVLAEMLTATLGAQCMTWETSPAAAELEEMMMTWLKQMLGLPADWEGVIHDTASAASLIALLTAREKYSHYEVNETGLSHSRKFRIYGSTETHSSIEKAVKIAGFGKQNFIQIPVDKQYRLDPEKLQKTIEWDLEQRNIPLIVVVTLGTTGSTSVDQLNQIADICVKYNLWLHIDAALAGTALVLPEMRWMIDGIEKADSFVFNPHKWMFTNFDCSAYFVKDKEALIRTFEILPEYLKTTSRGLVNDYRDWGIALGRRFRALKLWFVIRNFGVEGIQEKVRFHLGLAKEFAFWVNQDPDFELMAPVTMNTVCFRYKPLAVSGPKKLDELNENLLHQLNSTGKMFISHSRLNGRYVLRMVTSQTYVEKRHVEAAWKMIREVASQQ